MSMLACWPQHFAQSTVLCTLSCVDYLYWLLLAAIASICLCAYFSGQCKGQDRLPRPAALLLSAQSFGNGPRHPAGGIFSLPGLLPFPVHTYGPAGNWAAHSHHLPLRDPGRSPLSGLCLSSLWLPHHRESTDHTRGQRHCQLARRFPQQAVLPEAVSERRCPARPGGGSAVGLQVHQRGPDGWARRPRPRPLQCRQESQLGTDAGLPHGASTLVTASRPVLVEGEEGLLGPQRELPASANCLRGAAVWEQTHLPERHPPMTGGRRRMERRIHWTSSGFTMWHSWKDLDGPSVSFSFGIKM